MPMVANPGGAAGWGMQGMNVAFGASAIGAAAYGGANYAAGEATGFNPLTGITPTPWAGAVYGAATGMPWPWQAASAFKEGIMGPNVKGYVQSASSPSGWRHRGSWMKPGGVYGRAGAFASKSAAEAKLKKRHFGGMIGWKTMLLGVQPSGGMWAKLSIGNVGLSTIELIGKSMQAFDPTWKSPVVAKMANARRHGLAGMANISDLKGDWDGDKVDLKHGWLYKLAGIDPDEA